MRIGMTASALLTFGIGRLLGRRLMDHLSGSWVHRISRTLAEKGSDRRDVPDASRCAVFHPQCRRWSFAHPDEGLFLVRC